MASLVLREIGANKAEYRNVLELFTSFREHVIHVSATPLLPDQIAVTTKNGFVELISTTSGEFRLFLTYLDRIPLDASLRCFSLVPSLYAASLHHHHHLLYSLSYSNELLLADVESGVVQTLATCASRPSVVACDGDYVICGEGNGWVAVWRGSAEERDRVYARGAGGASLPPLLWQRALFEDAIVCAAVHRDQLVCCSADFGCVVVSVEDGQVRASLSAEPDRVIAAFALTRPSLAAGHGVLAVCQASRISVFAMLPSPRVDAAEAVAQPSASPLPAQQVERWTYRGGSVLEGAEEVACASCLGAHMAVGTRSGLVLLYACDATAPEVKELVRFNVGYGVKGTQLFADDTLLVVTSAGDVWRWPLCDLLSSTEQRASQVEEEGEEPVPAMGSPPVPAAAPGIQAAAQGGTTPSGDGGGASPAIPHEVSYTHEGDAEDRNLSMQDSSAVNALSTPREGDVEEFADDAAAAATGTAASASDGEPDRETLTRVRLPLLHRPDDTDLTVSDDEDADAAIDKSLDTRSQPMEPPTTRGLSALSPASVPAEKRGIDAVAADKPAPLTKAPALLYDPERAVEGPDVGAKRTAESEAAATGSAETSHCESVGGVSPPSSADTTARIEFSLQGASSRRRTPSKASGRGRYDFGGVDAPRAANADCPPRKDSCVSEEGSAKFSAQGARAAASPAPKGTAAAKEAQEMARLEGEFDEAMARVLGPTVSIEGLRRGRRMDPRKVASVLRNFANQQANDASLAEGASPALAGLNSTKLLEEKRASVGAAAFDFEAYRQAHRLEVEAMQYQHPIKALTYALQDRVFDGVDAVARIQSVSGAAADIAEVRSGAALPPVQDELRDVMHGCVRHRVDPAIAEERRRGGPDVAQHRCEDLLFPPRTAASAVLFHEDPLLPGTAWEEVLLLPLPLPPASSVF